MRLPPRSVSVQAATVATAPWRTVSLMFPSDAGSYSRLAIQFRMRTGVPGSTSAVSSWGTSVVPPLPPPAGAGRFTVTETLVPPCVRVYTLLPSATSTSTPKVPPGPRLSTGVPFSSSSCAGSDVPITKQAEV